MGPCNCSNSSPATKVCPRGLTVMSMSSMRATPKEYVIRTEVYGRRPDYDPRTDATVRVEAAKLRKRLSEYYDSEGRDDAVVIYIPKGHYRQAIRISDPWRRSPQAAEYAPSAAAPGFDGRLRSCSNCPGCLVASTAEALPVSEPTTPGFDLSGLASCRQSVAGRIYDHIYRQRHRPGQHGRSAGMDQRSLAQSPVPDYGWRLGGDPPSLVLPRESDRVRAARQRDLVRAAAGWYGSPDRGRRQARQCLTGWLAVGVCARPEIWTAGADGRAQARVLGVPERYLPMQTRPAFSPDGHWIAFFDAEVGPFGDIWVIASEGGIPRRLTFDQSEVRGLVWSPDGRWIIFSSARRGSLTLWSVLSTGGKPEPLTTGAGEDSEPAISSDGRKVIYTNAQTSWSLMTLDPSSGMQQELVTQHEMIGSPSFSPDGKKIAFFQPVDGSTHLFVAATDGSAPKQITQGKPQDNILPSWSADGSALYYYQVRPVLSFRRQVIAAGTSSEVAGWAYGKQNWAQVDPSGRIGAYTSVGTKGPLSTLLRDLVTGRERPMALVLTRLKWSPDGQWILGESGRRETGESSIALCRISDNRCTEVTAGLAPRWSADGRLIYFLRAAKRSG